ncbi:MAG: rhomboid family intramembrane serine protease [Treponema sp.]|nr:rhomboid family intramembrane serine protease [Treponema sp.]
MNIIRRPFKYKNFGAVYWLIGINILVFAFTMLVGSKISVYLDVGKQRYIMSITDSLAMIPIAVLQGWVWSFVTYMFVHGGFSHILFNMLGLFIFGIHVERQMGSLEFLLFYFITGILAGIFSFGVYFYTGNFVVALVGASGALYAVQLAYAVLFPNAIVYIWGILPLRAPIMVLGFTILSLFFIFTGTGGNIAHLTHLAGFGFCWLYFLIRFGINPWRYLTGR